VGDLRDDLDRPYFCANAASPLYLVVPALKISDPLFGRSRKQRDPLVSSEFCLESGEVGIPLVQFFKQPGHIALGFWIARQVPPAEQFLNDVMKAFVVRHTNVVHAVR
jgi:hypothetical protein